MIGSDLCASYFRNTNFAIYVEIYCKKDARIKGWIFDKRTPHYFENSTLVSTILAELTQVDLEQGLSIDSEDSSWIKGCIIEESGIGYV